MTQRVEIVTAATGFLEITLTTSQMLEVQTQKMDMVIQQKNEKVKSERMIFTCGDAETAPYTPP